MARLGIQERERIIYCRCRIYTVMLQWLIRSLISFMGNAYVWLDKRIKYTDEETSSVLGLEIDDDLRVDSRYELCQRVEETFELENEVFWYLPSTQKIRFAVQQARNLKQASKFE